MNIFDRIYLRAKKDPKKIVLPEGQEPRIMEAASFTVKEGLARIVLLGKSDIILEKARNNNIDISNIELVDPQKDEGLEDYIQSYWQLRKDKGVTVEEAEELLLKDPVYYGAMMLRKARVDGFVAGASHTTSDVARAILRCISRDPEHQVASGSFLIELKDKQYGENGLFLLADCGIVPLPSPEQLADIAITSVKFWNKITGYQPRVAMLSFSTKGSSSAPPVSKVRKAYEIAKKIKPDLIIDGELQLDSAIVPAVAKIKVPDSPLAGRANILIFPDLDAGNIAYKLIQRLAQARVVGPLIQGLSRPCSDLSRGATPKEIIDAIAVTVVMAQQ